MMEKQEWVEGMQTSVPKMAKVKEIMDKDHDASPTLGLLCQSTLKA